MRLKKRLVGSPRIPSILAGLGLLALVPSEALAIEPFVDASDRLENPNVTSGVAMGVADMNNDGLDDIVRMDDGVFLEIEHQQEDGSFSLLGRVQTPVDTWSMAIGDVDGNGYNDVFVGGAFDDKLIYLSDESGEAYTTRQVPGGGTFVQCSSFVDINNDGQLDFFVCHDIGKSRVYINDGDWLVENYDNLDPVTAVPTNDDAGNYGNVWTDYDKDGDVDLYLSRCSQGESNPNAGQRINQLFENDGNGNYTDVAGDVGLRPFGQTWATDFADIDNDGDMDAFILNHDYGGQGDAPSELYENVDNEFTSITDAAGIRQATDGVGTGIQTYFGDFDNDGWVDLLLTSGGNGSHRLLMNNGDQTFTDESDMLNVENRVQSIAIGDLNNDGSLDILAGFASGFNNPTQRVDRVLLNAGNDNNWVKIHLTGVESNLGGVGARIEMTGAWGMQTREVRAGESYGISHSFTQHFGLGTEESVESIVITWPSGQVDTILDPPINARIDVTEGCQTEFFADEDGDGFGDPEAGAASCIKPAGAVTNSDDCDDTDPNNYPGNEEVCDGSDNNCNEEVDEGLDETCNAGSSSGGEDGSTTDDPTGDGTTTTGPDPTDASASGSDGSGGETAGGDGGSGGGGCTVGADGQPSGGLLWLMMLGLCAPLARRRK